MFWESVHITCGYLIILLSLLPSSFFTSFSYKGFSFSFSPISRHVTMIIISFLMCSASVRISLTAIGFLIRFWYITAFSACCYPPWSMLVSLSLRAKYQFLKKHLLPSGTYSLSICIHVWLYSFFCLLWNAAMQASVLDWQQIVISM